MDIYSEETHSIKISVTVNHLEEESDSSSKKFIFQYIVSIENNRENAIQLTHRQWFITNGKGEMSEVSGEGVVGEAPIINPGEKFMYSSFCPLDTPTGNMSGKYKFKTSDEEYLEAKIPLFYLKDLSVLH